jgi:hypothetical protein
MVKGSIKTKFNLPFGLTVASALIELFLAGGPPFIPVIGIQLIAEVREDEVRDCEDSGYPDDEFEEGEHTI